MKMFLRLRLGWVLTITSLIGGLPHKFSEILKVLLNLIAMCRICAGFVSDVSEIEISPKHNWRSTTAYLIYSYLDNIIHLLIIVQYDYQYSIESQIITTMHTMTDNNATSPPLIWLIGCIGPIGPPSQVCHPQDITLLLPCCHRNWDI